MVFVVKDIILIFREIKTISGPEFQCLRLKLNTDFSGCENKRLKLIKIKVILIFLKITILSLTTNTTSIQAINLAFDIGC